MKKNASQAIPHIQRAVQALGDDLSTSDARTLLRRALSMLQETQNKRDRRNAAAKAYAEEALNKNAKWWETIKENMPKKVDGETLSDIEADLGTFGT